MYLRARQFAFEFPRPALIMGVLNVTPDSFSDGGQYLDSSAAIAHGLELVAQGAEMLDIGGESTRPGAEPVSEQEELRRVLPALEGLATRVSVPLSIDTMKPGVARAALEAGASLINDVAANREESSMWELAAETGAGYVCMHMQGTPLTMQEHPVYEDVVKQVAEFFHNRIDRLCGCGVKLEQIILDPGIGFGKTLEHNLQLLGRLEGFADCGRPILLGVSRKSFMAKLLGARTEERLPAGLACACLAVEQRVQLIRTHDVKETVQAVRMAEAVLEKRKVNGAKPK
jgi:dihydropteroate synthase